jgi:hypothetical protein
MSERACARCGAPVGPDEYLCWRCRQELPAESPVAESGSTATATAATPGEEPRTFRGGVLPRGMVLPSRVQYHGTVLGLIAVGIVIVLTLGVFVSTGVGPFIVSGISAQETGGGQTGSQPFVTGTVTNRGDHAGRARCVVLYTDASGGQIPTQSVETRIIQPHATGTVTIALPPGVSTHDVVLDCK